MSDCGSVKYSQKRYIYTLLSEKLVTPSKRIQKNG